jgi:hypothetical protein
VTPLIFAVSNNHLALASQIIIVRDASPTIDIKFKDLKIPMTKHGSRVVDYVKVIAITHTQGGLGATCSHVQLGGSWMGKIKGRIMID